MLVIKLLTAAEVAFQAANVVPSLCFERVDLSFVYQELDEIARGILGLQ